MANPVPDNDKVEDFQNYLEQLLDDYEKHLLQTLTKSTVSKHSHLISHFIGELVIYDEVTEIQNITVAMCGSKLVRSFNIEWGEGIQLKTAKNTLHRFFSFVAEKENILVWPLLHKLKS